MPGRDMPLYQLLICVVCYVSHVTCAFCPNGWVAYETSCYLFARGHPSSFTEAEHYCRQHHNAHLIEIETAAENMFIRDFLRGLIEKDIGDIHGRGKVVNKIVKLCVDKGERHWIGLTDEQTEGVWRWYNSDTVTVVTDWYSGQPNSYGGGQDCVVFDQGYDYMWGDERCMDTYEPICELREDIDPVVG